MESPDATPRAVVYSALLHLGIVGFLALAMLNCTHWEGVADALHLPEALRPVTCTQVVRMQGPVIEATLVGPAAAPPAPAEKQAPKAAPPEVQPPMPEPKAPEPAPVKVLPTPVPQPKLQDQEKIAEIAQQNAEKEKQAQEEQRKQRMAELAKEKEAAQVRKELAKVKAEAEAQQRRIKLEQQKAQQLADLRKAKQSESPENVPAGEQAKTGQAGVDNAAYSAALTNVITRNWLRPDNIPDGTICPVEIKQIPGGQVTSVNVLPTCPLDGAGKRSVENAVLRSSPLPYKGFEKQFQRDILLQFKVTPSN